MNGSDLVSVFGGLILVGVEMMASWPSIEHQVDPLDTVDSLATFTG